MSNQCVTLNVFVLLLAPQAAALSGSCSETTPRLRPTVFDIREFGAVGDGRSCNTKVIQLAIDACTSAGGGEVLIAGGSFVTGTIYLKDNVTLHLAADRGRLRGIPSSGYL